MIKRELHQELVIESVTHSANLNSSIRLAIKFEMKSLNFEYSNNQLTSGALFWEMKPVGTTKLPKPASPPHFWSVESAAK